MTRSSIVRSGHSNWLIGLIAGCGIIAIFLTGAVGKKEIDDNRNAIRELQHIQNRQDNQQAQLDAQQRQEARDIRCTDHWAVESNRHDLLVQGYDNARVKADVALQRAIRRGASDARIRQLRQFQIKTDLAYLKIQKLHPVPIYKCASLPPVKVPKAHPPSVPAGPTKATQSPHPAASTATVILRIPVPGPTTTVTVTEPPGKGRTVTHTNTVTASSSCVLGVCLP